MGYGWMVMMGKVRNPPGIGTPHLSMDNFQQQQWHSYRKRNDGSE
jgi:hypothetical protein